MNVVKPPSGPAGEPAGRKSRKGRGPMDRPAPERVKAQFTVAVELLCKLDLMAGRRRRTRSDLLAEWIAEKTAHLVIQERSRPGTVATAEEAA